MGLDLARKTLASSLSERIRDSEKTHGVADASCKKMASNSENTPFNSHLWACKDTACLGSRDGSQHARAGGAWEGSGTQLQHKGSLPATPLSAGVTDPFRRRSLWYSIHRLQGFPKLQPSLQRAARLPCSSATGRSIISCNGAAWEGAAREWLCRGASSWCKFSVAPGNSGSDLISWH